MKVFYDFQEEFLWVQETDFEILLKRRQISKAIMIAMEHR